MHGTAPKGLKQPFVPELRLLGCVEVDRVFALPLQKDTDLVAVPLNAKIKLQRAKNMEQLETFIEYSRFYEKAQRLLCDARDRLQIVDLKMTDKEKKESKNYSHRVPTIISGLENGYVLRKSVSCDSAKYMQHCELSTPLADDYDDIDQIYDYVRGFAPLPKNLNRFEANSSSNGGGADAVANNSGSSNNHSTIKSADKSQPDSGNYSLIKHNNNNNSLESIKHIGNYYHHHHYSHIPNLLQDDGKPIPPPIETIPGKKLPEKRQRPTLPKLYVKNANASSASIQQHAKSPNGNTNGNVIVINSKDGLEPQSPLFHIR